VVGTQSRSALLSRPCSSRHDGACGKRLTLHRQMRTQTSTSPTDPRQLRVSDHRQHAMSHRIKIKRCRRSGSCPLQLLLPCGDGYGKYRCFQRRACPPPTHRRPNRLQETHHISLMINPPATAPSRTSRTQHTCPASGAPRSAQNANTNKITWGGRFTIQTARKPDRRKRTAVPPPTAPASAQPATESRPRSSDSVKGPSKRKSTTSPKPRPAS